MTLAPSRILVTGGAGFIGSHLIEKLLLLGHHVIALDNFLTGNRQNITSFLSCPQFELIEADIRDFSVCCNAVAGCDYVFHEAALGSVPRSIENPLLTLEINVQGFFNVIEAARAARVKRFIFASSSSVYGTDTHLRRQEFFTGKALNPYALSKQMNEATAENYARISQMEMVGLRYFNVFGPRQNAEGAYAAVIPKFIQDFKNHDSPVLHGDGSFSRDFTYIDNIIFANLRALYHSARGSYSVFNIGAGESTSILQTLGLIRAESGKYDSAILDIPFLHDSVRAGDIPHSTADISLAEDILEYLPQVKMEDGIRKTVEWFFR